MVKIEMRQTDYYRNYLENPLTTIGLALMSNANPAEALAQGFGMAQQQRTEREERELQKRMREEAAQLEKERFQFAKNTNQRDFSEGQRRFDTGMNFDREKFGYQKESDQRDYGLRERQFGADQAYRNNQIDLGRQRIARMGAGGGALKPGKVGPTHQKQLDDRLARDMTALGFGEDVALDPGLRGNIDQRMQDYIRTGADFEQAYNNAFQDVVGAGSLEEEGSWNPFKENKVVLKQPEKPAASEKTDTLMTALPDAASNKGRVIRNMRTGEEMVSDGRQWVRKQ